MIGAGEEFVSHTDGMASRSWSIDMAPARHKS
jgi:hypothetical protein